MDAYVSPYGFSPVTDSIIDSIGDSYEVDILNLLDGLTEEQRENLGYRIDKWWEQHMSPARDKLSDILSEFVELESYDD